MTRWLPDGWDEELEIKKARNHDKECESAALAAIRERIRKRPTTAATPRTPAIQLELNKLNRALVRETDQERCNAMERRIAELESKGSNET